MTTLYDVLMSMGGDADVYDNEYDCGGVAWVLNDDVETYDDFDKALAMMAQAIEARPSKYGNDVIAKVSKYIQDHMDVWTEFAKEFNDDNYQITDDEDGIYNAVLTIENLVPGNYCEEAYGWLVERLSAPHEEGEE